MDANTIMLYILLLILSPVIILYCFYALGVILAVIDTVLEKTTTWRSDVE